MYPIELRQDIIISRSSHLLQRIIPPKANSKDLKCCREGKFELTRKTGEPSFYNVVMKLTIFNISASDFGTYRCLAKNPQGESSGEISLYGKEFHFVGF